jgi:hypothetical protein
VTSRRRTLVYVASVCALVDLATFAMSGESILDRGVAAFCQFFALPVTVAGGSSTNAFLRQPMLSLYVLLGCLIAQRSEIGAVKLRVAAGDGHLELTKSMWIKWQIASAVSLGLAVAALWYLILHPYDGGSSRGGTALVTLAGALLVLGALVFRAPTPISLQPGSWKEEIAPVVMPTLYSLVPGATIVEFDTLSNRQTILTSAPGKLIVRLPSARWTAFLLDGAALYVESRAVRCGRLVVKYSMDVRVSEHKAERQHAGVAVWLPQVGRPEELRSKFQGETDQEICRLVSSVPDAVAADRRVRELSGLIVEYRDLTTPLDWRRRYSEAQSTVKAASSALSREARSKPLRLLGGFLYATISVLDVAIDESVVSSLESLGSTLDSAHEHIVAGDLREANAANEVSKIGIEDRKLAIDRIRAAAETLQVVLGEFRKMTFGRTFENAQRAERIESLLSEVTTGVLQAFGEPDPRGETVLDGMVLQIAEGGPRRAAIPRRTAVQPLYVRAAILAEEARRSRGLPLRAALLDATTRIEFGKRLSPNERMILLETWLSMRGALDDAADSQAILEAFFSDIGALDQKTMSSGEPTSIDAPPPSVS